MGKTVVSKVAKKLADAKTMKREKIQEQHMKQSSPKCTVIVKNLPFSSTAKHIKKLLQECGPVKNVQLVHEKNANVAGYGIVEFHSEEAVGKAIKSFSGKFFKGRKIKVKPNFPCEEYSQIPPTNETLNNNRKNHLHNVVKRKCNSDNVNINYADKDNDGGIVDIKEENYEDFEKEEYNHINYLKEEKKSMKTSKNWRCSHEDDKNSIHWRRQFKKGRIIVRNLPFQVNEDKIRKHFKQFGAISEIVLLKNDAGKKIGCGFVQFETSESAMEAISKMNGQILMGRTIICDKAVEKDKYIKQICNEISSTNMGEVKIKEEPLSDSEDEGFNVKANEDIKTEDVDSIDLDTSEIKVEKEFYNTSSQKGDGEDDDGSDGTNDGSDNDSDDYGDHYYDDDDDDDRGDNEGSNEENWEEESDENDNSKSMRASERKKKPKVISNDVSEGCTVFIKNIPYSTTKDELEKCMKQFGPLWYAVICIDHLTEHSKGSGFVKFKRKEDADICLEQSGNVTLGDNAIEILPALPRNDIKNLHEEKKRKKIVKDNRHLYLAREGVIMAGSHAARGVSVADMEKRLNIERWKTQMLRNLNMFVSNTRLIIYNVPLTWKDENVRSLFKKYAGEGAKITEARVMRNLKTKKVSEFGTSKGYAFVRFEKHEHALNALRNINNNPNVFTPTKRPIVLFSIENKAILRIKQIRMEKSRVNNQKKEVSQKNQKKGLKQNRSSSEQKLTLPIAEDKQKSFVGEIAKPGSKAMRSAYKLDAQSARHVQNVRDRKRKLKTIKTESQQKKIKREVMPKAKRKNTGGKKDTFENLVAKYKATIGSLENQKRWYE